MRPEGARNPTSQQVRKQPSPPVLNIKVLERAARAQRAAVALQQRTQRCEALGDSA
jgi:hypothetical protein